MLNFVFQVLSVFVQSDFFDYFFPIFLAFAILICIFNLIRRIVCIN